MDNLLPVIGFAGSVTASTLFFPQVYAAWKTKQTKDLSWNTLYIGLVNGFLWISYGILKNDPFLYITNSLLFTAIFLLSLLKRKYG